MKVYAPELLELLSRRRYIRANFAMEYLGGSLQNRNGDITYLHRAKAIKLVPPDGDGSFERQYSRWFFRIYEKSGHHEQQAFNLWHQVLVDDLLISIETACKRQNLSFTDREEILKGRPLELPCAITDTIDGVIHRSTQPVKPDAIFKIEDTYFVLEADRGTEPLERNNLKETSYRKKILQYADVLRNKTYQKSWGIPNMVILNLTTKQDRVPNLLQLVVKLKLTSKSMCFAAYTSLASTLKSPQPLLTILTDAMQRVGHPPFIIAKELHNGRETKQNTGADNAQGENRQRA